MKFTYNNQKFKLILFSLAGSRFYGTHYEPNSDNIHPFNPEYISDHDFRGVFISDPDTKLGLTGTIETIEVKKDEKTGKVPQVQQDLIKELNEKLGMDMPLDEDIALYEAKKFITLALDNNPNICDILFTDGDAIKYINKKGRKLLENTSIFLSKKTKFTFSGYAVSQLRRIKSHKKMLVQYPKVNTVIDYLKESYEQKEIDFNWITDHFGGRLSEFVTVMKQQEANKLGKVNAIEWDDFVSRYTEPSEDFHRQHIDWATDERTLAKLENKTMFEGEWEKYRKPQLLSYCQCKDLKAHKLSMDEKVENEFGGTLVDKDENDVTIKDLLTKYGSFRTISKTQKNLFTAPDDKFNGGIFSRNGNIKSNDTEEVGTFVCQVSIDENRYKGDSDAIAKLWEWRTKRNDKRSVLEERFGYDVKHGSHLLRLLIGAKNILTTGEYHPRLKGDNLELVKSALRGEIDYETILEMSHKMEADLKDLYDKSTLPKSPNHKKANELLLELTRKF